MGLLKEAERKCVILTPVTVKDGAGGEAVDWQEGAEFVNCPMLNDSKEARTAEKLKPVGEYSGLVDADAPLSYGTVFRDTVSGDAFRVTSNPEDNQAPFCASPMLAGKKYFTAEKVELPK